MTRCTYSIEFIAEVKEHDRITYHSQVLPRVQGVENGYFGFIRPDGSLEESFEADLAKHESNCNEVLVCAKIDLFHWPHGSREKLAFYAALLYSRATQRRDFNEKNHHIIIKQMQEAANDWELLRDIATAMSKELRRPVREKVVRKGITKWLKEAQQPETAKNVFLSDLLRTTKLIASLVLQKRPWRVVKSPEGAEFATSDNPLVTFVALANGKLHPGYGFGKQEVVAAFPLAPHACLVMGNGWNTPRTLNANLLAELNEAIVGICDRYVYSRTRSDQVQAAVSQYAGTVRYGINAFLPIGIKLPEARQALRAHFGLAPE